MKRSYSRLKIKTRYDKALIKPENRILNAQREVPQKFWALMGIGEFSMFFFFFFLFKYVNYAATVRTALWRQNN